MLILTILSILPKTQVEALTNIIRPTNVLGALQQHASFSFVKPGLVQTAFAFNGPSSHQSFRSSVGDPHLIQKVQPSVAQALTYRNLGLGFLPIHHSPVATIYTATAPPTFPTYKLQLHDYQQQVLAVSYQNQLQQYQHYQQQLQPAYSEYVPQISSQPNSAHSQQNIHKVQYDYVLNSKFTHDRRSSEIEQRRHLPEEQSQQHRTNLLGIAYSSSPSVAHVKVNNNGYKFDF